MQIPKEYPLVVATALTMSWQCWKFGVDAGRMRMKIFNKDFMDKEFGQLHQREVHEQIEKGGFPDAGTGLYSQKLSYSDWFNFNVRQRIHLNTLQTLSLGQWSMLSAGLYEPKVAAGLGMLFIIGRGMYAFCSKKRSLKKGRHIGFLLTLLSVAINTGLFIKHLVKNYQK